MYHGVMKVVYWENKLKNAENTDLNCCYYVFVKLSVAINCYKIWHC